MKKLLFLISLNIYFIHVFGQYFGGSGDGFQVNFSGIVTFNDQSFYCAGAESDGFAFNMINGFFYNTAIVFSGGYGDGFILDSDKTTLNMQFLYCRGGNGDGTDDLNTPDLINAIQYNCHGGNGDGTDGTAFCKPLNLHGLYCSGGNGDGFDLMNATGHIFGDHLFCYGAEGDGFANSNQMFLTLNHPQIYCSGASGDGFFFFSYCGQVSQSIIFSGGQGDGVSRQAFTYLVLGKGIWTGNSSSDWESALNWKHHMIPDSGMNVFIPSVCQNYPRLTKSLSINSDQGYFQCHRLDIDTIGFLDINASLHVNGIINIYGTLTSAAQGENTSQIGPQGNLFIRSIGQARFGVK
jgi:hypothetical protein